DVVAAANDQLLLAIDDEIATLLVDASHVAGLEPPIGVDRLGGRFRTPPVPLHHVVPGYRDLAAPAGGGLAAVVVDKLQFDAADRSADRAGGALTIGMIEARHRRG